MNEDDFILSLPELEVEAALVRGLQLELSIEMQHVSPLFGRYLEYFNTWNEHEVVLVHSSTHNELVTFQNQQRVCSWDKKLHIVIRIISPGLQLLNLWKSNNVDVH